MFKNNKKNVANIYKNPPNKLLNNLEPKELIFLELKSHMEVTNLLKNNDVNINELAGFVIASIEKASVLFERISATFTKEMKSILLDDMIQFLKEELNKLDDINNPKLNLNSDFFYILVNMRNFLDSINNMFSRVVGNDQCFDKKLICDTYIDSLSKYLLTAQEWCLSQSTTTKKFVF